jgi:regulator of protease activity HflC (stomatin/prohibitin superfamily)
MIGDYLFLLTIIAAVVLMVSFSRKAIVKTTIYEYQRGLKYHKGRFKEVVNPGQYWIFRLTTSIQLVDIRPTVLTIPSQEVLTQDNIPIKISLVAVYEIVDPYLAIAKANNYYENLYSILQLTIRRIVGSMKLDELLEKRNTVGESLLELSRSKVGELGLSLRSVDMKDLMLPSDLKKAYTQVIKAQKEGLSVLEKARGEMAALRHLANAAKMLEDNPMLFQLRLLQSVGESSGNTLVIGSPNIPVPTISKKDNKDEKGSKDKQD